MCDDTNENSELLKRLERAGLKTQTPAVILPWETFVQAMEAALRELGVDMTGLPDDLLVELARDARRMIEDGEVLAWKDLLRLWALNAPGMMSLLVWTQEREDDEGLLTELYENAVRIGDVEGYWVDGGASADLFDE